MTRSKRIKVVPPQPRLNDLFSERLRTARALRGLSQRTLARQAGVTTKTIEHYEIGIRVPAIATLRCLGRALDVTTDYLLGLVEKSGMVEINEFVGYGIKQLSDSDRELARKILRVLVKRNQATPANGERPKQVLSG